MRLNLFNKAKSAVGKIKLSAFVALLAVSLFGFVQAVTSAPVLMEGHVQSLNVTAGQTTYQDTTSAKIDEVVQVQLWHHNREMPTGEKAKNTVVKFGVPNQQGKTQVISGSSTSDNGNTISDTTTVNLSVDRARVEYIPGTAKFRYNKGAASGDVSCQTGVDFPPERCYTTVTISDNVVSGGVNLDSVRGGPLTGCNAFHETVTIQVRVKADVVSVNKYVRHKGQDASAWKVSTTAKPGDELEYLIRFKNEGNTQLRDVKVGDNLPKYNSYVNGTTMLQNGENPNGVKITSDNITKGGIDVGHYNPGAVGYVWFGAKLDPISAYEKCGTYDVRNVGVVRPAGMNEFYNTAQVLIDVECKEEPKSPVYSCDLLEVKKLTGRKVEAKLAKYTAAGGATFKDVNYDFGDGQTLLTNKTTVEHEYAKDGTYSVRATVRFNVDGKVVSHTSDNCVKSVSFTTPPTTPPTTSLPNTGPGDVAAVFALTTVLGAAAHRFVLSRRYS